MSFAQIQLLGNVGQDPQMTYTPDGVPVTKFSLAVSRKIKDGEHTDWYNCTAWRGLAEMVSTHVKKGQMVFVQGDITVRKFVTKEGNSGISTDVTVDKFQFAGGKKEAAATVSIDNTLGDLDEHPF